jgi:phosphoribosylformimino-5-aminoimidazole carboxamide ribotide isomerase
MIAIPAIDLREGTCVQLANGDYSRERYREADVTGVMRRWIECGFQRLHVVDLDAATGRGSNDRLLRDLVRDATIDVQAGGGLRRKQQIDDILDAGARYVVLGTRAINDVEWLAEIARARPDTLVVAADVLERCVVTHGWQSISPRSIDETLDALKGLPLAGVLVTAVHREGLMQGTDLALFEGITAASHWPVFAAGGIGSLADLRALAERGVAGAIIGMALYTGAIDPWHAAEEFAQ